MSRKSDKDMLNPSILFAVLGRCVDVLMILKACPCSEVWHLLLNEEREVPSGRAVVMFRAFSLMKAIPTPYIKACSRIRDWEAFERTTHLDFQVTQYVNMLETKKSFRYHGFTQHQSRSMFRCLFQPESFVVAKSFLLFAAFLVP